MVTTIAGGVSGSTDGFGTNAALTSPKLIGITTTGQLYFTDSTHYTVRLMDTTGTIFLNTIFRFTHNGVAGRCASGYYTYQGVCLSSPAGYYKPALSFTDNYYICATGFYSSGGASACSPCSSSTSPGATSCPPTVAPALYPTSPPTVIPSIYPAGRTIMLLC